MKVLCVSCERLAELASYRVDAGVLVVTCSRCGAEMRAVDTQPKAVQDALEPQLAANTSNVVPLRAVTTNPVESAAQLALAEDPFAAPEGRCPKCIAQRRDGALSCHQCGLTFVNFVADEVLPPPPLDKLWRELLSRWDETEAHDKLLAAAATRSALPSIARLYQIRIAMSPDDLQARRGRDEVLRLATASGAAFQRGSSSVMDPKKGAKIALFVIAAFVALMLFGFLIRGLLNASAR